MSVRCRKLLYRLSGGCARAGSCQFACAKRVNDLVGSQFATWRRSQLASGCWLDVDSFNQDRYGAGAPKHCERIWIKPKAVRWTCGGLFGLYAHQLRTLSGLVSNAHWLNDSRKEVSANRKIIYCKERWVEGKEWRETEEFHRYVQREKKRIEEWSRDEKYTNKFLKEFLEKRYSDLDLMYESVKRHRKLFAREELSPTNFREKGGIMIHLDETGEPLLADGMHRFAAALLLELEYIPAMVGIVHPGAVGAVGELRSDDGGGRS